ncbi:MULTISPECIES: EamA family transporter [unclassified Rhizobium]|uniref:EamA family transporter n=1 Tax=unclassified Rhizobium TaxID=2613769 RepID=UPI0007162A02|nr:MULTISPECIES: EamA family transporter [unclassified Rhizobium]KQS87928.1 permease [Rhizobium sp. Leaf386]KQS94516.1 permease [Rhizobium sp. Leaf391]KQU01522.1 permease [Rhizobium sp. Leaf453]
MDQSADTTVPSAPAPLTAGTTAALTGGLMCLLSMSSVQFGSAFSASAISAYGPSGTTWLRLLWAAALLAIVVRPPVFRYTRAQWQTAGVLGASMAGMTLCFFAAIERIPLGLAVAIDFLGPLTVATFAFGLGWRLVWPLIAGAGVLLLAHDGHGWIGDPIGVLFAFGAATGWGLYIILMKKAGSAFEGLQGLSMSLIVAAVVATPFGLFDAHRMTMEGVFTVAWLALLVPLIPYALEMIALRRMSTSSFGILMSLEPALGAIAGFLVLSQPMTALQITGTLLVVAASAGATATGR